MQFKEFFDRYGTWGESSLENEETQLLLFRAIGNNLRDDKIQQIIDWKEKRYTESYGDDGYAELCETVMRKFTQRDFFSSRGHHEILTFVSEAVLYHSERNKELQLKIKRDKLAALKREIEILESEDSK